MVVKKKKKKSHTLLLFAVKMTAMGNEWKIHIHMFSHAGSLFKLTFVDNERLSCTWYQISEDIPAGASRKTETQMKHHFQCAQLTI